MATTTTPAPRTPKKRIEPTKHDELINVEIQNLSHAWDLRLPVPTPGDSPSKRRALGPSLEQKCVARIKYLYYDGGVRPSIQRFHAEADILYQGWVHKPKAERGVVPEATRHGRKPVTDLERAQLLACLEQILDEDFQKAPRSPASRRSAAIGSSRAATLDDSAIPSPLPKPNARLKRTGDERFDDLETSSKKMKQPEAVLKINTLRQASANAMPPPARGRHKLQDSRPSRSASASTSFASNASSIFSASYHGNSMFANTQETVPDDEDESEIQTQPNTRPSSPIPVAENFQSSEYEGGSSFEQRVKESMDANGLILGVEIANSHVDEVLSQDLKEVAIVPSGLDSATAILQDRLEDVFPALPHSLKSAPFCVAYEITRVFLHADVPMEAVDFASSPALEDYDALWRFLKELPVLKGKQFPERCGKEVWDAAMKDFKRGPRGVMLAGSLHYNNESPANPLFRFQLEPLRLDLTHRLSRRFGTDRFMEIDMPHLSGRQIPKSLSDLGESGQQLLINWLVDGTHRMLGRSWKPFHTKVKDRRGRKQTTNAPEDAMDTAHRVYFFAIDGDGFQLVRNPLYAGQYPQTHLKMEIKSLMDRIRPTRKNMDENFLKLFARTDLAVSKNTATIILERPQIIHEQDITCNGEVMTDGAGRLSPTLALEITRKLGLSYQPSGFQARFGEAKGFWTVDNSDRTGTIWIKVYESQRKWAPSRKADGEANDPSHRTFEVLRFSGPLKSADLNLQLLPLLTERAKDSESMKGALARLLEQGLERELLDLQTAMDDPQSFRKWLRDGSSGINERLKHGCVPYRASLPVTTEERLNTMLDAGFNPKQLYFIKDLARIAFRNKCDILKQKLNITVGKSTYAYMVPDFAGVLEPNEVYIDFSSFIDDTSGFSGVLLNDVDVLVARSPAHYVSDIQKVRAVFKVELMGLKDVIIFPTKGNPSLAAKLSGGDYDGDIAWVCWEASIVDNFVTADVPKTPNLVEEGFIHKNGTTYRDLVQGLGPSEATSVFLKEAFKFNMQQSMLGICTVFKEHVCYHQRSVDTRESLYLSTLLSSLVDQSKQGYTFTEDDFTRFKSAVIKIKPGLPSYKTDHVNPSSPHVIDRLVITASKKINKLLTEFHNSTDPPTWDEDLVVFYKWARSMAANEVAAIERSANANGSTAPKALEKGKQESQWQLLLDRLDDDIRKLKTDWAVEWGNEKGRSFSRTKEDESRPEFMAKIDRFYELFQAIKPYTDTPFTQALLPNCLPDPGVSNWADLRASALFFSYRGPRNESRFPWFMAGRQLARLKSQYGGGGFPHAITPKMFAMLKPDAAFVKRSRCMEIGDGPAFDENASITNAEEIENFED